MIANNKKRTRKLYNFKQFDNIFLGSSAFTTLKVFKSKKQLTRYFNLNSFDLSSVESLTYSIQSNKNSCLDLIKDCEVISLNNTKVFIKLDTYINTLILYSFVKNLHRELKKDLILTTSVKNDLWSRVKSSLNLDTNTLSHRLDLNFIDLYSWLYFHNNSLTNFTSFIARRSQINSVFRRIYFDTIKGFQNVLDYLEWNLDNNKINQDVISGLFFRNNELISFYKGIDYDSYLIPHCEDTKNNFPLFYSGGYTNYNDLFINRNFCRLSVAGSRRYSTHINYYYADNGNTNIFGQYISSKETVVFNNDEKTKNDFPSINLQSNNNMLRDYSFKIASELPFAFMPYEKKNKDDLLYLGLEIECNKSARCPTKIIQLLEEDILAGTSCAKHDGSLGHRGLELNIVPMTLDYAKQTDYYFKFEKRVKDYLNSYRDIRTGIHIHIPRKLFTNYQIGQLVQFVNMIGNYDYICAVGGRVLNDTDNNYAETRSQYNIQYYNKRRYDLQRASALNVTLEKTLEFRIFKGNLSAKTIYRYMEFVHGLATYVKSNSCNSKTKFNDFIKWIENNCADYPILNEFNKKFTYSNLSALNRSIVDSQSKQLRPIESFELKYKKRFNNISFNIPTLKLAKPLRLKRVRAVPIRYNTPQTNFNFE
jgi:hypothetical protein